VLRNSDGPEGQPNNAAPEEVSRIADVMSTYRPPWALCGGWAVDAWLGRVTREHGDVDIAVFVNDREALFEHLAGWQLLGHEETMVNEGAELWDGRALVPPAHLHGRSPEDSGPLPERFDDSGMRVVFPSDGFWLDVNLCERSPTDRTASGEWVLNREPRVAPPLAECIRQSGWGIPTVTPEVLIFFKMTLYVGTKNHLRPQDEADFVALLPLLSLGQREWLREAVSGVYVGEHPWLGRLRV
jgi:Aminoglycoside-2''-adenylyltransferase